MNKSSFWGKFNKKQKILFIVLIIILIIEILMITHKVFVKYIIPDNEDNSITEIDTTKDNENYIDNYNYYLSLNSSSYQKELFSELKSILGFDNVVIEDYADVLTKMFVSDLFSLKTKLSGSDITCSQYVYKDYKDTFELMLKNTLYSNIEIDLDGTRNQELPLVTNVEILSVTKKEFVLNNEGTNYESFEIETSISYEKDLGFPVKYRVVLIKKDNLLEVVKSEEL